MIVRNKGKQTIKKHHLLEIEVKQRAFLVLLLEIEIKQSVIFVLLLEIEVKQSVILGVLLEKVTWAAMPAGPAVLPGGRVLRPALPYLLRNGDVSGCLLPP